MLLTSDPIFQGRVIPPGVAVGAVTQVAAPIFFAPVAPKLRAHQNVYLLRIIRNKILTIWYC